MIPEYLTPGAFVRLRDGSKVLIYATDGGGDFPVHGGIESPTGRIIQMWTKEGHYFEGEPEHNRTIVGPWVEKPESSKLWPLLPPWIKWLAMDEDGEWFGYGNEPTRGKEAWQPGRACGISCGIPMSYAPKFSGGWEDSLTRRPE